MSVVLEAPVLGPPTAVVGAYESARRVVQESGCRAIRFCPGRDGYPLADWVLSPLPELCEREELAIVIDFDPASIAWSDVMTFARAFPTVPMVVLGVSVAGDRAVLAALDAAANLVLHVEEVGYARELARLIEIFGEHRFITSGACETAATLARGEWRSIHL